MRYLFLLVLTMWLGGCYDGDKMAKQSQVDMRLKVDSLRSATPPESSGSRISPGLVLVAELKNGESPPCDSIYFARLDSLNALLRPQDCLYSTEAEVCKVRGHNRDFESVWPEGGGGEFTCKYCGGTYGISTKTEMKELRPPTK